MPRQSLPIFLFLSACVLASCGGGVDCPIDPPDCCYNVLSGCQLFDLPQGCSCSQYGLGFAYSLPAARRAVAIARASAPRGANLSGGWSGTLKRISSSCKGALPQVRGTAAVTDRSGRISVSLPGYGTLKGKRTKTGFTATGTYAALFSLCSARVETTFKSLTATTALLSANVSYNCFAGKTQCAMRFQGTVKRQR